MTIQEQMKDLLGKAGIPAKEIRVYGSQIVITCWSHDAATKFANFVGQFAKVSALIKSIDEAKVNHKTCLNPSMVDVYRVFASL